MTESDQHGVATNASRIGFQRIVEMTDHVVPQVVDMHLRLFEGYMGERLGRIYINAQFRWFQANEQAISLIAIGDSGEPLGYIIGAEADYATTMNRDLLPYATLAALRHPGLLFDRHIRRTAFARLKLLFGNQETEGESLGLSEPTMALVGIGVSPLAHGQGIGHYLLEAFELRSQELGARSMLLSVYPNNNVARQLYEKCGWRPSGEPPTPDTTMYYVRTFENNA